MQPSSIEVSVLQPTTLQKELPRVSSLCILRATALPHSFWAAIFLLFQKSINSDYYKKLKQKCSTKNDFVKNLFKAREKKLRCFESLMLLALLHYVLNMSSIFTFHMPLEVLYDN